MQQLIDYKKHVASRYFPLEGDQVKRDLPESDGFFYSEKIDGHLGFAVVADGQVSFYNRSARQLELPELAESFPNIEGVWAGELYVQKEGERSRSFHISTAIASDTAALRFAVFDAVHALDQPIWERLELIKAHIKDTGSVHPLNWHSTQDRSEVLDFYQSCIDDSKEGVVIHTQQGRSYKVKPVTELDVCVLGYSLKEDGTGMRSLLVGLHTGEAWVILASVGGGYSSEDRLAWEARLADMEVPCNYVMVAKNGLAYKWVKPEIVIQIKCIEAITEDAKGDIIKETVSFNEKNANTYDYKGKMRAASLLSPVFLGERDDKTAGQQDTGLNQISDRVELSADNFVNKPIGQGAEPTVLDRLVYTKKGKHGTAVRKFVAVQTNANASEDFAAYYVYVTDFSAGRKDPLKVDIFTAPTQDELMTVLEEVKTKNVKKGWVLVE